MNRLIIRGPLLVTLLLLVRPASFPAPGFAPSLQEPTPVVSGTDSEWLGLAPEREEFSAMVPTAPSVMTMPANFQFENGGEEVLEHRGYSGYANGFVFVIESYRAANPQKIFNPIVQYETDRMTFELGAKIDGHVAKEIVRVGAAFRSRTFCLVAKEHVYVLLIAARDEKNTFSDRFLSSFKLNDPSVKRTGKSKIPASAPVVAAEVLSAKEVTRKATVAWKPEPSYTEQARRHQVTGKVALNAIFAADGQLTDIKVVAGLEEGLTKKAIEAARNIRFFPAEKDGRLVSQEIKLEYHFVLY